MSLRGLVLSLVLIFFSFVLERIAVYGFLTGLQVPWLSMSVAFLILQAPLRFGYGFALALGALLDIEQARLFGFNMLNFTLLVSAINIFHHRLTLGGWPLVVVVVPLIIFSARLFCYGALWIVGGSVAFDFWLPLLALLLIWPLYYALLQLLRSQMNLL